MREALKGGRRFLTAQGTGEWILRTGSRGIKRRPIWLTMRQPTEPARALPGDPAGEQADRVVRETGPPPVLGKAWLGAGGSGEEEYFMSRLAILEQPTRPPVPTLPATDSETRLIDSFGRRLTYLRVSVTDRCNLRCTYCLPADAEFPFGDRDFLSATEIEQLVGALARLGIRRVRLTGGEPLLRRDILEIARRVKALPGI